MPKSRRQKMVSLTNVKKKGREGKEELVEKIQDCVGEYEYSYVLSFENMRSGPFKNMQSSMHNTTKFFLGKNKVMIRALGKHPEDEVEDNTHQLSRFLTGQVCLAFSSLDPTKFLEEMKKYEVEDFAQSGAKAEYTVFLEKGKAALDSYGHALETQFRTLGLPTKLNFQKIELLSDVFVCRDQSILSVEQAKLLKLLGHKMAKFSL